MAGRVFHPAAIRLTCVFCAKKPLAPWGLLG
jgi:hypothetical protein